MNVYDIFLVEEIFPAIIKSLKAEDARFRKEIENSEFVEKIYKQDVKNLTSNVITERTLQYFIYRDLCKKFQIWPEEMAYIKSKKRVDLAIYKEVDYESETAEIGIEIKKVRFTKEGLFRFDCLQSVRNDLYKLKRTEIKNKYILLLGISDIAKLNPKKLKNQIQEKIDNRKLKNYDLIMFLPGSFKAIDDNGFKDYILMFWKLVQI
jgi:hypothetical protein